MTTWTPDRPTKPGKYWLSLPKHIRAELDAMVGYKTPPCFVVLLDLDRIESLHINCAIESVAFQDWTAGAQWRPYVEPPDPFAEPVPQPVDRLPSDAELVKSAIRLMRTPRRRYSRTGSQRPLWSRVMMLFGHGSTYSRAICRAHGFDPDEVWMIEEARQ